MSTPLETGSEHTAAEILEKYVNEPDSELDSGLDKAPYAERDSEQMSYFKGNDSHGSGFRHYYIPDSLLPPILGPKGVAPYRADRMRISPGVRFPRAILTGDIVFSRGRFITFKT